MNIFEQIVLNNEKNEKIISTHGYHNDHVISTKDICSENSCSK